MIQLILILCCIGVVVGKNVYDYREYIDELEIPCTVGDLKSVSYVAIIGGDSEILFYVNGTIVNVDNCRSPLCIYTYNETNVDSCMISITNRQTVFGLWRKPEISLRHRKNSELLISIIDPYYIN